MYQFSTTNVINSQYLQDYNGNILKNALGANIAKYSGTSTVFTVPKVGSFKKANIVSVHKRPYSAGVYEVATLTVSGVTTGDLLRFTVEIKQSQTTQSEYVNYTTDFKLPVVVEVISSGTAATDAAAIVAQLNGLKNRFGYNYFTASVSTATITITATEYTQRFSSIILSKAVATASSITQYDQTTLVTGAVTVPGALGFGDDFWMMRSVMVPTAENVRLFGFSKDERPILGGNYTEYVLRYQVTKDGQDGIVSGATSVTTHVFYVISTLQAAFETALNTTYQAIVTIGGDSDLIIVGDQKVAASAGATQYTVLNATGTVNWTNTVLAGTTSANTTGILTVGATTGSTTLTATDAAGKTATLVITVE